MNKRWHAVLLLTLALVFPAWAEDPTPRPDDDTGAAPAAAEPRIELHPRQGEITLGNNLAKLKVPDSFKYLDPQDTEKVLVAWGNPKGIKTLGMLPHRGGSGKQGELGGGHHLR